MTFDLHFRPLVEADLPTMHTWLNEPGVVRWWEGDDVSWQAVVDDYGPNEDENYEHWIALIDDEPVGWIQCGPIRNEPEAASWFRLGVDEHSAGIDYLIGALDARGRGLGSAMISQFVDEIVFGRHPEWTQVAADPYDANIASCKALENAGFHSLGLIEDEVDADGPSRLMMRDR